MGMSVTTIIETSSARTGRANSVAIRNGLRMVAVPSVVEDSIPLSAAVYGEMMMEIFLLLLWVVKAVMRAVSSPPTARGGR